MVEMESLQIRKTTSWNPGYPSIWTLQYTTTSYCLFLCTHVFTLAESHRALIKKRQSADPHRMTSIMLTLDGTTLVLTPEHGITQPLKCYRYPTKCYRNNKKRKTLMHRVDDSSFHLNIDIIELVNPFEEEQRTTPVETFEGALRHGQKLRCTGSA